MYYELWDFETRNRIGTYQSKDEALALVRDLLATNFPRYPDALALLGYEVDYADAEVVAEGRDLADLARRAAASGPDGHRLTA